MKKLVISKGDKQENAKDQMSVEVLSKKPEAELSLRERLFLMNSKIDAESKPPKASASVANSSGNARISEEDNRGDKRKKFLIDDD